MMSIHIWSAYLFVINIYTESPFHIVYSIYSYTISTISGSSKVTLIGPRSDKGSSDFDLENQKVTLYTRCWFQMLIYTQKNWEDVLPFWRAYFWEKTRSIALPRTSWQWYSRWTNYSNPGQLYPPRPPNFKVVFFFQGLRRVDKTNQTPQHDTSRTRSLTLIFGEGGVVQSFPRGLNILSIYGMLECIL